MVIVLSPSLAAPFNCAPQSCGQPLPENHVVDPELASQSANSMASRHSFRSSLRRLLHSLIPRRRQRHHHHHQDHQYKQEAELTASTSAQSTSLLEHSLALMRSSSIRSLGRSFRKQPNVDMLDETWEDWLEQYQNGTRNLSTLSRPVSFWGFGYMAAPHHKDEIARLRSVKAVSDRRIWRQERDWLDEQLRTLLIEHRLKTATVSLVDKTCQLVMHDIGLGKRLPVVSRELSIDAHTILSAEYFALLDAGSDWRTRLNPLVHGPPFIKFYIGVPIFVDRRPVGCIAVFDPYLKAQVPKDVVAQLTALSRELSSRIMAHSNENTRARRKTRIQWADDEDSQSLLTIASNTSGLTSGSEPSVVSASLDEVALHDTSLDDTRISPLMGPQASRTVLQPYEVFESLLRCRTVSQAIKKACRIVWQNLGCELVYIVEARLRRKTLLPATALEGLSSGSPLSAIPGVTDVHEHAHDVRMHFVGHYGPQIDAGVDAEVMACTDMHRTAILSKYGFKFSASEDSDSVLQSGLLMPFRRQPEHVYWDEAAVAGGGMVPCWVWRGGFVMGAFVSHAREFSPGDVAFTKKVVKAVENILTCRDEQCLA